MRLLILVCSLPYRHISLREPLFSSTGRPNIVFMSVGRTALLLVCVVGVWGSLSPLDSSTAVIQLLQSQQLFLDGVFDNVLLAVRQTLLKANKATISLPDFEQTFGDHYVQATEGWFQDLSSVQRTGSAVLTFGDGNVLLGASLGLQTATVGYTLRVKRSHWFMPFTAKGHVKIYANSNSIHLQAGVDLSGERCMVAVKSITVENLTGLWAEATGFGFWSAFINDAVNKNLDEWSIRSKLQDELSAMATKFAKPCADLLPSGTLRNLYLTMLPNKTAMYP